MEKHLVLSTFWQRFFVQTALAVVTMAWVVVAFWGVLSALGAAGAAMFAFFDSSPMLMWLSVMLASSFFMPLIFIGVYKKLYGLAVGTLLGLSLWLFGFLAPAAADNIFKLISVDPKGVYPFVLIPIFLGFFTALVAHFFVRNIITRKHIALTSGESALSSYVIFLQFVAIGELLIVFFDRLQIIFLKITNFTGLRPIFDFFVIFSLTFLVILIVLLPILNMFFLSHWLKRVK